MKRITAGALAFATLTAIASAQSPAPDPTATVTLDPPRVMVGQKTTLVVTVLAPNYMPAPPVIPDFQVRNAVTRSLGAVNQTETRDGVTFAGIRYEFAIYPQEAGNYALASQPVTVTYAVDPPNTRKVDIALPRQTFEAFIPDAAQDLDPFVAAESLTVEQKIERSSQDLKVGDSIKRTVTMKGAGTPAMLLPPPEFAKIDGLALYPDQPVLQDNFDQRSGALSATRTDDATYMLQRAGDYTLPAINFAWWNARDSKIERARADAVTLHVADNPAWRASAPGATPASGWNWHAPVFWLLDHWLLTLVALLVVGAIAWVAPAAARTIKQRVATRRASQLASEAWSFEQLRAAIHRRDAEKAYFALLDWLRRFGHETSVGSVEALKRSAQDAVLNREISAIETNLFGPQDALSVAWSPRRLLKRVTIARRRLRRSAAVTAESLLPDGLNPQALRPHAGLAKRPVAR
jgi:hypothetical protein